MVRTFVLKSRSGIKVIFTVGKEQIDNSVSVRGYEQQNTNNTLDVLTRMGDMSNVDLEFLRGKYTALIRGGFKRIQ